VNVLSTIKSFPGFNGHQPTGHPRPGPDEAWAHGQKGRIRPARPRRTLEDLQDPRAVNERRARHPLRAPGPTLSQQHRRRDPQRLHRGRDVRDPCPPQGGDREGLFGRGQQSDQVLREV